MSVKLYMDQHVHIAITRGLRERGLDVMTTQEDGRADEPDALLLDRALELGRLLFTQDEDFLAFGRRRQVIAEEFHGIAYAAQTSITIGSAIANLELICKVMCDDDVRNEVFHLPI